MRTYGLTLPQLLSGTLARGSLVADYAEPAKPEIDAKVHSGDYFIMPSTTLDAIAAEVAEVNPAATSLALAEPASELDYVQCRYQIVKKS